MEASNPASHQLQELRDHVARRWQEWRALRWCARLATIGPEQVQAELRRGPPTADDGERGGALDAAVFAAISELPGDDRLLLGLLVEGCDLCEIAARRGISKDEALQGAKTLLCKLLRTVDTPVR